MFLSDFFDSYVFKVKHSLTLDDIRLLFSCGIGFYILDHLFAVFGIYKVRYILDGSFDTLSVDVLCRYQFVWHLQSKI